MYIYIYTHRQRERERDTHACIYCVYVIYDAPPRASPKGVAPPAAHDPGQHAEAVPEHQLRHGDRRGPKGRLAKGRLAKGRKQCALKHSETYRTPIFWTVPLPNVPLVPSKVKTAQEILYGLVSEIVNNVSSLLMSGLLVLLYTLFLLFSPVHYTRLG